MSTIKKKRPQRKNIYSRLSPAWIEYLLTGETPEPLDPDALDIFLARYGDEFKQAWNDTREELLKKWITDKPGTRPFAFWRLEAPEPRQRIGGKGKTRTEEYPAVLPTFENGIPGNWFSIDPEDPPTFESEATYLKRHDLLTASEIKRLKPEDYEPETITYGEDHDNDKENEND